MSSSSHPGSVKVARLLGVDLNLHWSLSFLLLYVMFVSTAQYPSIIEQSGLDAGDLNWNPWVFGLIFALGLFGSVVAHELGHVAVAQSLGVKVRGITLMMLGGVSVMGQVPETPYAEFKLAVVGPLVSLAISGILWLIHDASSSPNLSLVMYWLANANLVLAVFNLIPALPLDGGRALRSFLAVKYGSLKATQTAVKFSQLFAWVLGLIGFLSLNLFLMLIAFFVYSAAQSELVVFLTKAMLKGMQVGEVMTSVESLSEDTSIQQAVEQMIRTRNQVLPIRTASGGAAILSLEAIRAFPRENWQQTAVSQVMEQVPTILDVNEPIQRAIVEMTSNRVPVLPVKSNEKIVGLLKYSDLSEMMQFKSLENTSLDEKKAA